MTADTYRARAAECLAKARLASHEADKAAFLEMAEEWLRLALSSRASPAAPVFALVG